MNQTPEEIARDRIDQMLRAAGTKTVSASEGFEADLPGSRMDQILDELNEVLAS